MQDDLSSLQFECLTAAINLARKEQVTTVDALKARLLESGHEQADINAAVEYWIAQLRQEGLQRPSNPRALIAYPLASRDDWYGNADYSQSGGELSTMSPDDYLAQVQHLEIDDYARENIDDLKTHILAGNTLDPLVIYADGEEDGRHRAVAAKELGIEEVPVITWPRGFHPDAGPKP